MSQINRPVNLCKPKYLVHFLSFAYITFASYNFLLPYRAHQDKCICGHDNYLLLVHTFSPRTDDCKGQYFSELVILSFTFKENSFFEGHAAGDFLLGSTAYFATFLK